jgi:isoquinoline 1-oxidoreductase
VPQGSYRALAATANAFARESMIDELARAAAVDPLDYRLRHTSDPRLAAVLRAAAERAGWASRGRGWGIAGAVEKEGRIATIAQVDVDGARRVRVARIVAAYECGAIVEPDRVTSQVEGALIMGLGGALFEALRVDRGRVVNGRLSAYRVPHIGDVPPIEVVLVDRRDLPPSGAGETPLVAIAPAIANAIADATGVRLRTMPLVPDGTVPP